MQTLIIYDNKGKIFTQITGNFIAPVGLQHIITNIPEGKTVMGVDVSATPHQVILEDIPPTETEILRERIAQSETALMELAGLLMEVLG